MSDTIHNNMQHVESRYGYSIVSKMTGDVVIYKVMHPRGNYRGPLFPFKKNFFGFAWNLFIIYLYTLTFIFHLT